MVNHCEEIDEMEGKVKALYSEIPKATGKPERIYYPVSDNDAPIIYIGNDKEVSTPNVQIFFKHDATTNEEKESMAYLIERYLFVAEERKKEFPYNAFDSNNIL